MRRERRPRFFVEARWMNSANELVISEGRVLSRRESAERHARRMSSFGVRARVVEVRQSRPDRGDWRPE